MRYPPPPRQPGHLRVVGAPQPSQSRSPSSSSGTARKGAPAFRGLRRRSRGLLVQRAHAGPAGGSAFLAAALPFLRLVPGDRRVARALGGTGDATGSRSHLRLRHDRDHAVLDGRHLVGRPGPSAREHGRSAGARHRDAARPSGPCSQVGACAEGRQSHSRSSAPLHRSSSARRGVVCTRSLRRTTSRSPECEPGER